MKNIATIIVLGLLLLLGIAVVMRGFRAVARSFVNRWQFAFIVVIVV